LRYHKKDLRNPKMWEVVRAGADKGECFPKVGELLVDVGVIDEDNGGYEESRKKWCTGSHVDADGGAESDTALESNALADVEVDEWDYGDDDDQSDFLFEALRESCERRSSIDL
jgi:predicted amidohydrolase YtcJ